MHRLDGSRSPQRFSAVRFFLVLLSMVGCASKHSPVNEAALAKTLSVVAKAKADGLAAASVSVLAGNGLLELERGRLATPITESLDAYVNAPLDMKAVRIVAALDSSSASAAWRKVCTTDVKKTFSTLGGDDALSQLRTACGQARFEQLGLSSDAKSDPIAVMLALLVLGEIERGAPVTDGERQLLGMLAATPNP